MKEIINKFISNSEKIEYKEFNNLINVFSDVNIFIEYEDIIGIEKTIKLAVEINKLLSAYKKLSVFLNKMNNEFSKSNNNNVSSDDKSVFLKNLFDEGI